MFHVLYRFVTYLLTLLRKKNVSYFLASTRFVCVCVWGGGVDVMYVGVCIL
jgi:hypothetical protein